MNDPLSFARRLVAFTFLAGLALPALADDWPQWRGPQRDGKSAEKGLLQSWPAGGPPLAFKAAGLGTGFSTVAVAGGKIFTLGDSGEKQYVIALDDKAGNLLWKQEIGPAWNDEFLGPRSTPAVDGDRVYALSTEGLLHCLETATGKVVWKRSLPDDFGGTMMKAQGGSYHWKFAESPLVDGDLVIVSPGSREAALVALDKKTGKEVWRTAIPDLGPAGTDGAGYSSAVVSQGAGVRQYVQLLGRGLVGVDAKTGRFLWGYNRVANNVANIPTALVDGDYVFASTSYGAGAVLLKLVKEGPGVAAKEVYFLPGDVFQNHHGGMILHQGYVYAGSGLNKGLPMAIELATGKIAWGPLRNDGNGSAAVAYADGRLYFRYQNGAVILIEPTPAGYKEHGQFDLPSIGRPSWPHPVISGGRLYLREQDILYVYDIKAKS